MKVENKITRRKFVNTSATAFASLPVLPLLEKVSPTKKSLRLAEKYRGELLNVLKNLIKVQSLQGESAAKAQQLVKDYLSKLPYRIEESADRPSLYQGHSEYMTPNPVGDGPFINVVGWPIKQKGKAICHVFPY